MIKDVTDLEVYRLGLELLEEVYKLANLIPSNHRKLRNQFVETAEKIPPQIAEGFGKKKFPKEFCRFLLMAIGSSDEVITHTREIVILSKFFTRIPKKDCEDLIEEYKVLSRKLNSLHTSWQRFS